VADFKASPSVGDEISKGRNRYRFDGIGWSTIHRSTLRTGTLVVTKDSWYFIATAGQTTITGNDSSGKALSYDTNAEIEVFINGIKVKEGSSSDYVLTSSSVLTLNEALKVGEEVEIVQRSRFADTEVSGKVDATSAQTLTTAADALTISDHTITLTRGDGSTDAVTVPDNNNTYSVGDGGLTQKNFTTTLKNKLDGIAASANNYSLPAASSSTRGGVKIGFTESGKNYPVELSSEKMFVNVPWTDTNTTYSVGDGGLTQKNFTTTLKNKLDGIATGATADQTASEILTAIKTVDGSGSGLDADTVDGIQGSSLIRSDSNDSFSGTLIHSNQVALVPDDYGKGIFGKYSSDRYQHVWSMGTAYKTDNSGTSYGNIYGLTWTHTNVGTGTDESISGLSHQLQLRMNGTLHCAFGTGIWTSGNITAYSDQAVKTNLEKIPNALDKVLNINGYTYDRTDYVADPETGIIPDTRQAGVVAQEVEKVLPEVVFGEDGNKAVAYGNMVALLIEAIKEQQVQIDELKQQIA